MVTKFEEFILRSTALYVVSTSLAFGTLSDIAADCSCTEIR
jgi:hypothetical protein